MIGMCNGGYLCIQKTVYILFDEYRNIKCIMCIRYKPK